MVDKAVYGIDNQDDIGASVFDEYDGSILVIEYYGW